jgi:MFS family permease
MTAAETNSPNAFHYPRFIKYLVALLAHGFAAQIIVVALGWQVYDITRDPLDLGLIGLSQFLPALCLVLVTGLVADRFNRRLVMGLCLAAEALAAVAFIVFAVSETKVVWPVFGILAVLGVARAFFSPASDALAPNLLTPAAIPHGISLGTINWQLTSITGPVFGGLLYGFGAHVAYVVAAALISAAIVAVALVGPVPQENHAEQTSVATLLAGFKFIRSRRIILGAISLDLFAVLLGGAMALLPVYARDILHADAVWLGILRSSIGVGALTMALFLAKFGIRDHAGKAMFICVALFGVFTVVFGYSTWLPLSAFALFMLGVTDMVSVNVRETLMQLHVDDDVRGRVNAVNRVFIGASNELGEFRAGLVAAKWGAVSAVVVGGFGTIVVAGLWSMMFPELRKVRKLQRQKQE